MTAMATLLRAADRAGRELTDRFERDRPHDASAVARTAIARALLSNHIDDRIVESAGFAPVEDSTWIDTVPEKLRFSFDEAIRAHRKANTESTELRAIADVIAAVHERLASPSGVGVHYTPPAAARWMADSAVAMFLESRVGLSPMDADSVVAGNRQRPIERRLACRAISAIEQASIIDPACGTGNLLISLLDTLHRVRNALRKMSGTDGNDSLEDRGLPFAKITGFDIDAQAVAIARLRIAAQLFEFPTTEDIRRISSHFAVCNALDDNPEKAATSAAIVILNPPYVSTYSRQSQSHLRQPLRAFCERRGVKGRLNLFGCFILRAMELARERGVLSLIVPDTFASASSYQLLRAACRERFPTQLWLQIENRAFRAQVGSVILTCGQGARRLTAKTVRPERSPTKSVVTVRGDDERILMFASATERDIWEHVRASPNRIGHFVTIHDGVNTGPRWVRDILLDETTPFVVRRPLIEGGDIDRRGYLLTNPRRSILYDADLIDAAGRRAGASLRDAAIFDSPKVVTRQTADTLIAAVEPTGGVVALNSVHCWRIPGNDGHRLWGLAGFLNSSLVRLFYALDGGEQRSILPQVRIAWLRQLPVPGGFDDLLDQLSEPAREVAAALHRNANTAEQLETIDAAVCKAFGFGKKQSRSIGEAYLRAYPRFADGGASSESPSAIRVA